MQVWALQTSAGPRFVVINKTKATGAASFKIGGLASGAEGRLLPLTAPDLLSKTGVLFGGVTAEDAAGFGTADVQPQPEATAVPPASAGEGSATQTYTIDVPAHCAAVLSFPAASR